MSGCHFKRFRQLQFKLQIFLSFIQAALLVGIFKKWHFPLIYFITPILTVLYKCYVVVFHRWHKNSFECSGLWKDAAFLFFRVQVIHSWWADLCWIRTSDLSVRWNCVNVCHIFPANVGVCVNQTEASLAASKSVFEKLFLFLHSWNQFTKHQIRSIHWKTVK